MGSVTSKQDKCIADLPDDERYFGLENFGNTCYANSVLQILFFCKPFRREVLAWAAARAATGAEPEPESLLSCLADLFVQISTQKKKTGSVSPRRLMHRIKADNALFSGSMHQDAHEFFNYLLNQVHETLLAQARRAQEEGTRGRGNDCREARAFVHPSPLGPARSGNSAPSAGPSSRGGSPPPASTSGRHRRSNSLQALAQAAAEAQAAKEASAPQTWVQSLFQGRLVSETQCLRCESVTSREESMFDLSLDIAPNSSLSACLRAFAATEMLQGGDKFFCDHCGSLQEAYRRMRILQAPPVLCLHLKRFKYVESAGRLRKLAYRVVFPFSLTLPRAGALEGEAGGRENGGESGSGREDRTSREARTSREDRTYREDRINREEAGGQARLRKETASAFAAAALPPQPPRLKAQTPKAAPGSYPISCATSAEPQSADALFALRADSTASSPLSCGPSLP
ncbi:ubiquitin carboxyl-terminal hydrolase, partial [Helicosporidium sp. ATCC 50920]